MEFGYSKEQVLLRDLYKKFAETEVKPLAEELDEEERFPVETVKKLARYGFLGIPFPKEYGGAGGSYLTYSMAVEELAKVCGTTAIIVSAHTSLCAGPIYMFGTEEQKQKYLRPLVDGSKIGCFGLTEPGAGTDAAGVRTEATLDGDYYVLNGTKMFTTNSGFADIFIVFALTDKSKGPKGMSAFIVERESEGLSVGPNIERMGIRAASNCEVIYENVKVPKENLLGKEGQGFKIAMQTLDGGRIGVASQALGLAEGAIDECVKYVMERKQFGKKIGQMQNTQFELADMAAKVEAAKLLVYEAACTKDAHGAYSHLAAMAKYLAGATASDVTRRCVQLFGGYGYTRDYPIERMMRDAKITEIYEGTAEVQKIVISNWMKLK